MAAGDAAAAAAAAAVTAAVTAGRSGIQHGAAAAVSRGPTPVPSGSPNMPLSVPATMLTTAHLSTVLPSTALSDGHHHNTHLHAQLAACHAARAALAPVPRHIQQQHQLQTALSAAQTALLEELSSIRCEAAFPVMSNEWPTAREATLRPVLRASSDTLLSGPCLYHLCEPRPVNGRSRREITVSASAQIEDPVQHHVVALLQTKEVRGGW